MLVVSAKLNLKYLWIYTIFYICIEKVNVFNYN